jgi:hypothetical protein
MRATNENIAKNARKYNEKRPRTDRGRSLQTFQKNALSRTQDDHPMTAMKMMFLISCFEKLLNQRRIWSKNLSKAVYLLMLFLAIDPM